MWWCWIQRCNDDESKNEQCHLLGVFSIFFLFGSFLFLWGSKSTVSKHLLQPFRSHLITQSQMLFAVQATSSLGFKLLCWWDDRWWRSVGLYFQINHIHMVDCKVEVIYTKHNIELNFITWKENPSPTQAYPNYLRFRNFNKSFEAISIQRPLKL